MNNEEKIKELEKRITELERLSKVRGPGYNPMPITDGPDSYWPKIEPADKADRGLSGLKENCPKCGLKLNNGPMSYSCPNINCPCGMGPTTC